jgi:hypothetical protein
MPTAACALDVRLSRSSITREPFSASQAINVDRPGSPASDRGRSRGGGGVFARVRRVRGGRDQTLRLLHPDEAVAQRSGQPLPAIADSSSVGYGCAWSDGVTVVGAVSGPHSGDLVTMKLGEVVGHHH